MPLSDQLVNVYVIPPVTCGVAAVMVWLEPGTQDAVQGDRHTEPSTVSILK